MGLCESCCRCDEEGTSREEHASLLGGSDGNGERTSRSFGSGSTGDADSSHNNNSSINSKGRIDRRSAEYLQSIVDDATSKFISSTAPRPFSHHHGGNGGLDELKSKLASATLSPALLYPPTFEEISQLAAVAPVSSSSSVGGANSGTLQQQIVVDILSEHVKVVSSQIEVAIDEIAELVASQTFAFRIGEGEASSVVAKFK